MIKFRKNIWEFANPNNFLSIANKILPFFLILTIITLSVGLVWGLFFTPEDYRQGSSVKIIFIPLFKNANSLILFCKTCELNFIEENISFDGKKVIFVPLFLVLPTFFNGFDDFPFSKFIKYSNPSLKILNSSFSDKAFTTETPTPCNPPETLYES